MPLVKYTGLSHFRQLLKSDFAKVDVKVEQALTFARHEVVKVSDEVHDAIQQLVADEFETIEDDVKDELVRDAATDPQPVNMVPGVFVPPTPTADEETNEGQPLPAPTPSQQPPAGDAKSKA